MGVRKYKNKKGNTTYYFTFINRSGKRITRRGYKNREDAIEAELIFRKKDKEESKYKNYYLSTVAKKYMEELKSKKSESTYIRFIEMYRTNIEQYIDDKPLNEYTVEDITDFGIKLEGLCKTGYVINHAVQYLSRVFEYGKEHCNSNPCKGFVKYNENPRTWNIWSPEEFDKAIQYETDMEYFAYFNLCYWTGIRRGEARCLTWNDIDLDNQLLTISKHINFKGSIIEGRKNATKNKKYGRLLIISIDDELTEILRNLKNESSKIDGWTENSFVFGVFRPLPAETIRRRLKMIAKKSGNAIISPHMLRHSHASFLISEGATADEVAKRLGDSISVVLNTYSHYFDSNNKKTLDRINNSKRRRKNE